MQNYQKHTPNEKLFYGHIKKRDQQEEEEEEREEENEKKSNKRPSYSEVAHSQAKPIPLFITNEKKEILGAAANLIGIKEPLTSKDPLARETPLSQGTSLQAPLATFGKEIKGALYPQSKEELFATHLKTPLQSSNLDPFKKSAPSLTSILPLTEKEPSSKATPFLSIPNLLQEKPFPHKTKVELTAPPSLSEKTPQVVTSLPIFNLAEKQGISSTEKPEQIVATLIKPEITIPSQKLISLEKASLATVEKHKNIESVATFIEKKDVVPSKNELTNLHNPQIEKGSKAEIAQATKIDLNKPLEKPISSMPLEVASHSSPLALTSIALEKENSSFEAPSTKVESIASFKTPNQPLKSPETTNTATLTSTKNETNLSATTIKNGAADLINTTTKSETLEIAKTQETKPILVQQSLPQKEAVVKTSPQIASPTNVAESRTEVQNPKPTLPSPALISRHTQEPGLRNIERSQLFLHQGRSLQFKLNSDFSITAIVKEVRTQVDIIRKGSHIEFQIREQVITQAETIPLHQLIPLH